LTHARIVDKYIKEELKAKRVLEVGCGKGFNSVFLAERNQEVQFTGIDLTSLHVSLAQQKAHSLPNLDFEEGNYQDLPFEPATFDLVFAVETICCATDINRALAEIKRVIKPGGRFIIFDVYRKVKLEELEPELGTATRLVEISMAINEFSYLEDWLTKAKLNGFKIAKVEEVTDFVRPNILRLQKVAKKYFRYTWLAKIYAYFAPYYLVRNSIAGLLMPFTLRLENGSHGYYILTLQT